MSDDAGYPYHAPALKGSQFSRSGDSKPFEFPSQQREGMASEGQAETSIVGDDVLTLRGGRQGQAILGRRRAGQGPWKGFDANRTPMRLAPVSGDRTQCTCLCEEGERSPRWFCSVRQVVGGRGRSEHSPLLFQYHALPV